MLQWLEITQSMLAFWLLPIGVATTHAWEIICLGMRDTTRTFSCGVMGAGRTWSCIHSLKTMGTITRRSVVVMPLVLTASVVGD